MFVAFAVCFVWDTKPDFPSGLPYIPRAKHKTLNILNEPGLNWNSAEKMHSAQDSID